ncbi:hypothetical protein CLOM_g5 [Closterium sp. NIES-68]|nr:hypothetical protein CLOM_g5 [Closterium sp. NIES-68]GJP73587.1 hypothetical protein CLOP_g4278 [Closterium sp. NIES-67]
MAISRAALLLLVLLPLASAQPYPKCPLTGKLPKPAKVIHTRCPAAAKLSCCQDCFDLNYAIRALATNVTSVVDANTGGMGTQLGVPADVCGLFKGSETCELLVEQFVCAVSCNPDSGNYFSKASGAPILNVCSAFAQQVYDACGSLSLGELKVGDFLFTPADLIQSVLVPVIGSAVPNFNATISDVGCYGGPEQVPATPLCCDPLNVPRKCPKGAVNLTNTADIIGRKPAAAICADFPYSVTTVPFKRAPLPATAAPELPPTAPATPGGGKDKPNTLAGPPTDDTPAGSATPDRPARSAGLPATAMAPPGVKGAASNLVSAGLMLLAGVVAAAL